VAGRLTGVTEGGVTLAKKADATTKSNETRGQKKVVRRLEKAQLSHQKAERKASKLRVRLERAEARLAQAAHQLVAMQALLEHAGNVAGSDGKDASEAATQAPVESQAAPDSGQKPTATSAATTKSKVAKGESVAKVAASSDAAKALAEPRTEVKAPTIPVAQDGADAEPAD
jgi:multidrug resistance efflux pump